MFVCCDGSCRRGTFTLFVVVVSILEIGVGAISEAVLGKAARRTIAAIPSTGVASDVWDGELAEAKAVGGSSGESLVPTHGPCLWILEVAHVTMTHKGEPEDKVYKTLQVHGRSDDTFVFDGCTDQGHEASLCINGEHVRGGVRVIRNKHREIVGHGSCCSEQRIDRVKMASISSCAPGTAPGETRSGPPATSAKLVGQVQPTAKAPQAEPASTTRTAALSWRQEQQQALAVSERGSTTRATGVRQQQQQRQQQGPQQPVEEQERQHSQQQRQSPKQHQEPQQPQQQPQPQQQQQRAPLMRSQAARPQPAAPSKSKAANKPRLPAAQATTAPPGPSPALKAVPVADGPPFFSAPFTDQELPKGGPGLEPSEDDEEDDPATGPFDLGGYWNAWQRPKLLVVCSSTALAAIACSVRLLCLHYSVASRITGTVGLVAPTHAVAVECVGLLWTVPVLAALGAVSLFYPQLSGVWQFVETVFVVLTFRKMPSLFAVTSRDHALARRHNPAGSAEQQPQVPMLSLQQEVEAIGGDQSAAPTVWVSWDDSRPFTSCARLTAAWTLALLPLLRFQFSRGVQQLRVAFQGLCQLLEVRLPPWEGEEAQLRRYVTVLSVVLPFVSLMQPVVTALVLQSRERWQAVNVDMASLIRVSPWLAFWLLVAQVLAVVAAMVVLYRLARLATAAVELRPSQMDGGAVEPRVPVATKLLHCQTFLVGMRLCPLLLNMLPFVFGHPKEPLGGIAVCVTSLSCASIAWHAFPADERTYRELHKDPPSPAGAPPDTPASSSGGADGAQAPSDTTRKAVRFCPYCGYDELQLEPVRLSRQASDSGEEPAETDETAACSRCSARGLPVEVAVERGTRPGAELTL